MRRLGLMPVCFLSIENTGVIALFFTLPEVSMKKLLSILASAALLGTLTLTPASATDSGKSGDMQKNDKMQSGDMKKDSMKSSDMNMDKGGMKQDSGMMSGGDMGKDDMGKGDMKKDGNMKKEGGMGKM